MVLHDEHRVGGLLGGCVHRNDDIAGVQLLIEPLQETVLVTKGVEQTLQSGCRPLLAARVQVSLAFRSPDDLRVVPSPGQLGDDGIDRS